MVMYFTPSRLYLSPSLALGWIWVPLSSPADSSAAAVFRIMDGDGNNTTNSTFLPSDSRKVREIRASPNNGSVWNGGQGLLLLFDYSHITLRYSITSRRLGKKELHQLQHLEIKNEKQLSRVEL